MALDGPLQIRDARRRAAEEAETRFMLERAGLDRAERLRAWRAWAAKHLLAKFHHWPADQAARDHAVGLCIAELEVIARHLYAREWLFSSKRLAQIVEQATTPIAAAQREGKIAQFFPYFRTSIRRFVGLHAEELQQLARREGVDGTAAIGEILAGVIGRIRPSSLVEDIATRQAQPQQASGMPVARRRGRPRKDTGAGTLDLFEESSR